MQESAGLGIDRSAEKIGIGGVADVEMNGWIEPGQLDQIVFPEGTVFCGRRGGKRFVANLCERADWFDEVTATAAGGDGVRLAMERAKLRGDLKYWFSSALFKGQDPAVGFIAGVSVRSLVALLGKRERTDRVFATVGFAQDDALGALKENERFLAEVASEIADAGGEIGGKTGRFRTWKRGGGSLRG